MQRHQRSAFASLIVWALLFVSAPASALMLPTPEQLPARLLDQKDSLYYDTGTIPSGASSSLCGPTSAVNWLQLLAQGQYSKEDLVSLVNSVGKDLRQQKIEMNSGLTEPQLIKFLNSLASRVGLDREYEHVNRAELTLEKLLENRIEILMLNYAEIVRRSRVPVRRDDYMTAHIPVRGNHFVLKVYADTENSEIWLIDPENPGIYTRAKVENVSKTDSPDLRLRPSSRQDFPTFAFGVPLTWSVTGAVTPLTQQP